jgi:hypothetical protein
MRQTENHSMRTLTVAALTALTLASSAMAVDLSKLPPASSQQNVTFDKEIKPLFEASCVRCHSGERPKAGLRLNSLAGVLKGGKDGKVVQPGKSEKSDIVIAVAQLDPETAMPPKPRPGRRGPGGPGPQGMVGTNGPAGGPHPGGNMAPPKPLTPEQVGLVRAWVDQGAK